MKLIKNKYLILNLFLIILLFLFALTYRVNTTLLDHDYVYAWTTEIPRYTGRYLSYPLNNFLPFIFNQNPNDFRSIGGAGSFIVTVIFIGMCIMLSFAFFLNKKQTNIFFIKETLYILPFSFLCLSTPSLICLSKELDYLEFFKFEDITKTSVYFLVFIPFLVFLYFLFFTIVKNNNCKTTPLSIFLTIVCVLFCYILGNYNEVFNITALFILFFFSLYLLIKHKKLLLNKKILFVIIPFFIGLFHYYLFSNNFVNAFTQYGSSANLTEAIKQVLVLDTIKVFSYKYFIVMFTQKYYYYLLLSILFIIAYYKKSFNITIVYALIILLSFLLATLLEFFASNNSVYIFERPENDASYCIILSVVILIIFGTLYDNCKYKKKLLIIFSIFCTLLYLLFIINYIDIQQRKLIVRQQAFLIDKYNVVYSSLGEYTKLPSKLITEENIHRLFLYSFAFNFNNYEETILNGLSRIYNREYFSYKDYFEKTYKKKFLGVIFIDEETAKKELNKRLDLFDDSLENFSSAKIKNIKFNELTKKYSKNLTIKDIEKIEETKGNSPILLKAKAYIYYKNKDYATSLNLYNQYYKDFPNDIDAILNMADMYYEEGNLDNAFKLYKKLIDFDSNNLMFLYKILRIYRDKQDYKKALDICDKMINIEKDMYILYLNKAIILTLMEKYDSANEIINFSKKINDSDPEINDYNDIVNLDLLFPPYSEYRLREESK